MKRLFWMAVSMAAVMQGTAQQHFPREIPAGNYSGICPIGDDRYAVVSDKSPEDGFFVFHIVLDTIRGRIASIKNEGFRSSGFPNNDMEAVCYCPPTKTLFIASEANGEVNEYSLDGKRTGRSLELPAVFKKASKNAGLESLTFDASANLFYTTTEHPLPGDSLHRIQAFGLDLKPACQYLYRPDAPMSSQHVYGISELCALGDGRLLVLERQVHVPKRKIGATTRIRIYEVRVGTSQLLEKNLVHEFTTKLTVFNRSFGNYEALCQPRPGILLLMADSQNQYAGILRDWFKVIRL